MEKFDAGDLRWEERSEDIWVLARVGDGDVIHSAYISEDAAELASARNLAPWGTEAVRIRLQRPSLAPIYGGPTLLEALWAEMDSIMERLMTGAVSEDGQDVGRAQSIAWVIAITTNPYEPSIDRIRAEAMERWNAIQSEEVDPEAGYLGGIHS